MQNLNNFSIIRLWQTLRRSYRFESVIESTIRRLDIADDRQRSLLALTGIQGHYPGLPASDIAARIRSMEILYRAVGDYAKHEIGADEDILLGTYTCDTGLTDDREPHLRQKTFIGKTYRQIRDTGLNAICSIEIQALTDYPSPRCNALMLHAHTMMWGTVRTTDRQAAVRQANGSRAWANHFEAPSVLLKRPHMEKGGAQGWACYMTKLPDDANRIATRSNGKVRFSNHVSNYPNALALRIMEGLSHFSIPELVFGVGDGKYIRRKWISELRAWDKERSDMLRPDAGFDLTEVWRDLLPIIGGMAICRSE
jgi:hypothetical protein